MAIPQDTETTLVHDAEVIWYPQEPGTNDASDMYVMNVLGVRVLVRRRKIDDPDSGLAADTYIHIDTTEGAAIEVNSGGENEYS